MDIVKLVSILIGTTVTSVGVLISIIVWIFKRGRKEQLSEDTIKTIQKETMSLAVRVEKLEEHKEETNLTLVKIETNLLNMQTTLTEIRNVLLKPR